MNVVMFGREDVAAKDASMFESVSFMNLGAMKPGRVHGYEMVVSGQVARLVIVSAYFHSAGIDN